MSELRVALAALGLVAVFAVVGVVHRQHRPQDCFSLPEQSAQAACLWRVAPPEVKAQVRRLARAHPDLILMREP